MRKLTVFLMSFLIISLFTHPNEAKAQSWWEILTEAITESVKDSSKTFNEEYGRGATDSLTRGPKAMASIEGYRGRINSLFDQGRISEAERNRRLQTLFSGYDAYKAGRMSESNFQQNAETLTEP